jgi:hypothetical protein
MDDYEQQSLSRLASLALKWVIAPTIGGWLSTRRASSLHCALAALRDLEEMSPGRDASRIHLGQNGRLALPLFASSSSTDTELQSRRRRFFAVIPTLRTRGPAFNAVTQTALRRGPLG